MAAVEVLVIVGIAPVVIDVAFAILTVVGLVVVAAAVAGLEVLEGEDATEAEAEHTAEQRGELQGLKGPIQAHD
jgi:hypothetical protein